MVDSQAAIALEGFSMDADCLGAGEMCHIPDMSFDNIGDSQADCLMIRRNRDRTLKLI